MKRKISLLLTVLIIALVNVTAFAKAPNELKSSVSVKGDILNKKIVFTAPKYARKYETLRNSLYIEPKLKMDGKTYSLKDVSYRAIDKKYIPRTIIQEEFAFDEYLEPITENDVPKIKTIKVVNNETKKTELLNCNFVNISYQGTRHIDNHIDITYESYGSDYYYYKDHRIEKSDLSPNLSGYEDEILKDTRTREGSKIKSINWAGDEYWLGEYKTNPYTLNKEKITYRKATALIDQVVDVYRANYKGELHLTHYDKDEKTGNYINIVEANCTYERTILGISKKHFILVSTCLFIALILLILFMLVKKKKKSKKIIVFKNNNERRDVCE